MSPRPVMELARTSGRALIENAQRLGDIARNAACGSSASGCKALVLGFAIAGEPPAYSYPGDKVMARIRIVPESDAWLASQKERFDEPVRKKAFEIYRHHDQAKCSAVTDWQAAKHELELLPLAGVDETDGEIRISASVANERCGPDSIITVRVMPHHIVAESGNRFSVLNLPRPVHTDTVRARLDGDQLSLVAATLAPAANR